jgi:O-antigen ligase
LTSRSLRSPGRLSAAPLERLGPRALLAVLGLALLVRVLTDDRSAANSRHSGNLNLSGVIAGGLILAALGLLLLRRRGVAGTFLIALWLCLWTGVAVSTQGASTETIREGIREGSIVAVAVIAYNARDLLTLPLLTRLIQLVGLTPAILALYQLATDTGMRVAGNIRAHGTFAHPNSAAVFFALAATVSLWRYLEINRGRLDAALTAVFAAALVSTVSIDGLGTVIVMFVTLGLLRTGPQREKLIPVVLAGVIALAFFATPLGADRIAKEGSTNVTTAEKDEANTTLAWRLYKWKTLLPTWERYPLLGHGLGTTITENGQVGNEFAGDLPHNEYLRYLVETGALGLGTLLAGLALTVLALRRRLSGDMRNLAALALAVLVGFLVNALADNTLLYTASSYAAALIVAGVLALPLLGERSSRIRPA